MALTAQPLDSQAQEAGAGRGQSPPLAWCPNGRKVTAHPPHLPPGQVLRRGREAASGCPCHPCALAPRAPSPLDGGTVTPHAWPALPPDPEAGYSRGQEAPGALGQTQAGKEAEDQVQDEEEEV